MRHRKKGRKLGTDAAHTKAMKKSLTAALLANDRIKTTATRAKEIRPYVDRIITWAKRGDVHSRRLAIAKVGDKEIVREIFEKVEQGMFAGRNGGYTRIYRLGNRKGDNAPMVIMELVTEPVSGAAPTATEKKKAEKPLRGKKAQEKAEEDLVAKFKFDDDDEDAEASEEAAAKEAVDEAESETEEANDEAEEAAAAESEADETVATEETEETVTDEADAPAAEADEATEEPASEDSEEK